MIIWLIVDKDDELVLCNDEPFLKEDKLVWIGHPDFVFHLNQRLKKSWEIFMDLFSLKKPGDKIKLVLKKWPIE